MKHAWMREIKPRQGQTNPVVVRVNGVQYVAAADEHRMIAVQDDDPALRRVYPGRGKYAAAVAALIRSGQDVMSRPPVLRVPMHEFQAWLVSCLLRRGCSKCGHSGRVACQRCSGRGAVELYTDGVGIYYAVCTWCDGTGYLSCVSCGIPEGVDPGRIGEALFDRAQIRRIIMHLPAGGHVNFWPGQGRADAAWFSGDGWLLAITPLHGGSLSFERHMRAPELAPAHHVA